ncbi:MAG: response regulator transcription factor [Bacteroidota bacterium]
MTKILYVEDEPFLGKIVKESLETRSYQVKMVEDGAEVMAIFQSWQPDICVLDVMLPNKDGFTIGKEIRAINSTIPIIFLTAKNQTEDLLKGFQSGGNDYIKKPFSMEELIVRIENMIQLSKQNPVKKVTQAIKIGAFTFHPLKYQLVHTNSTQKLSHRENELFKMLAAHQNQAINRKEILLKIWGDDSYFNSRNLDVYIKKIRTYLQADASLKLVTLKGVGYHFVVS